MTQLTQFLGHDVINKNTTDLAVRCSTGSVELSCVAINTPLRPPAGCFSLQLCAGHRHWQGQLRVLFEHVSSEDEAICVGLDCTADGSGSLLQMYPTLSLPHLSVLASWLIHLTAGEFLRWRACDGWPLHVQRSTLYNRAKLDAILYWTLAAVRPLIDQSERMMDGVRTYAVMHKMNAINCSWAGFHILMASNYTSRTGLYVYCVADSIQAHVRDSSHTAVIHQSIKTTVRLYTYGDWGTTQYSQRTRVARQDSTHRDHTLGRPVTASELLTRSVATRFHRHGMPPPASNDTGAEFCFLN